MRMPNEPGRIATARWWQSASSALIPAGGLAALILLFFGKMAFSQLILARGDVLLYFYPYWQAASDAIRIGRLPLWNPNLFMGVPMLANSQIGFFYPLNWPFWLFLSVPYAVSASILLHLFIAGWGTYLAARRALGLGRPAAFLSGALFALGGYLTAQVEHVNQLQGLAWLPYYLILLHNTGSHGDTRQPLGRRLLGFSLLFALQLLAGHTQTSFITVVGLLIWMGSQWLAARCAGTDPGETRLQASPAIPLRRLLWVVLLGGLLSFALAAVQLIPTLELVQHSARQGGLPANEVLSFSLPPHLLGRALLPHFRQGLFTEYLATLPVIALFLALLGAWHWRRRQGVLPALLIALCGLLLAVGIYLPQNWLLARIPFFNLFRVPARWLVLYALGTALLAGAGWQALWDGGRASIAGETRRRNLLQREPGRFRRQALLSILILAVLMVWSLAARGIAPLFPGTPEAPFEPSNLVTGLGWLLELLILAATLYRQPGAGKAPLAPSRPMYRVRPLAPLVLLLVIGAVMFLASREHPYNNLTAPDAYFDLRPALARMQALARCEVPDEHCASPPQRFLSLSDIFFDPGDQPELDTIYAQQLPAAAQYDLTIAAKQKEIIAPNLPLAFGLHTVDGFDGGILPLGAYTQTMALILPGGTSPSDGRLREYLEQLPESRWLDLFNAGYLITDKLSDVWIEGVFFDRQFPATMSGGETIQVGHVPRFEGTALLLLSSGPPAPVMVTVTDGDTWRLGFEPMAPELYRAEFPHPAVPRDISLTSWDDPLLAYTASGLTLLDARDDSFVSLVLGNYRQIHSGDVKIYQNLDVLPRAFIVHQWQWREELADLVDGMGMQEFDPRRETLLLGRGIPGSSGNGASQADEAVAIKRYEPERVVITVSNLEAGMLVVTDAFYPGWSATVDGESVTIHQADGMFRGVPVPAGQHEVIFTFQPSSVRIGAALSSAGLLFWLLMAIRFGKRA